MPRIYGELQVASWENLSTNPAPNTAGRFWRNTTDNRFYVDDGVIKRPFLRNDQNLVIGSSGTASQNVRLNRSANTTLQLVPGDNITAEGSLSANLAQLGFRFESFTDAGKPSVGNAGRTIWVSDQTVLKVDTGTQWIPVGSGGGSGSLIWVEDGLVASPQVENNMQVYLFGAGLGQELYTVIRVPQSYVAGSQVRLRLLSYSPATAGDLLLQTISTLIRPGTDNVNTSANQRTSTNAAIALSGATVDIPQAIVFDLTDATGNINSIPVAAGNLIKVRLTRGTDTSTEDARALVFGAEVTFV